MRKEEERKGISHRWNATFLDWIASINLSAASYNAFSFSLLLPFLPFLHLPVFIDANPSRIR